VTPPDGLALPQVGNTDACMQTCPMEMSQLATVNRQTNDSHYKSQQAGACALAPNSPRLFTAIESLAKLVKEKSHNVMFGGCLVTMLALMRMYVLDDLVGWHTTSLVEKTAAGNGNGLMVFASVDMGLSGR